MKMGSDIAPHFYKKLEYLITDQKQKDKIEKGH